MKMGNFIATILGPCGTVQELTIDTGVVPATPKSPIEIIEDIVLNIVEGQVNSMLAKHPVALQVVLDVEHAIDSVISRSRSRPCSPIQSPAPTPRSSPRMTPVHRRTLSVPKPPQRTPSPPCSVRRPMSPIHI